ncbi:MAG: phosphate regulon transcriptional regulator PhoB [Roseovarius sp.]|nr:phosphate regulon transcriptional regulator PhoB [Roseovarius sp.]
MTQAASAPSLTAKILVVEDEPGQRELLAYNLQSEGWIVYQAGDGEEALLMAEDVRPDAIVLDWMLPGMSGLDVCRNLKVRPAFRSVPIIMLSARADETDKVRGLETGADDYVPKPYMIAELISRIRANLRRVRPTVMGDVLTFGEITLDSESHRVRLNGDPVHLGPTEFRLLATLIEKPGKVWSREALLDRVWGQDIYVDSRTVDVHIGRLRKALKQTNTEHPVRTVRGAGYAIG